jgi:ribosomal protein L11 methyltransferase
VAFEVPNEMVDEAAGILVANGALGCDVSKLTGVSSKKTAVLLRTYFERVSPATVKRLHNMLGTAGMLANGSMPQVLPLEDPGWATMWQGRFAPFRLGERFLIVPPWQRDREPGRFQIIIRPGQAFGTGHHPSTSVTLSAIEELCAAHRFEHALDVGTGSGILSIAMTKLGVARITAIDVDSAALANAAENARLNRVSRRIRFSTTPLSSIRGRFKLITANILSSTLIQMASDLKARLARPGYLVLAGILRREAESVAAAYRPDLSYVGARNSRAWTALIFQATSRVRKNPFTYEKWHSDEAAAPLRNSG